MTVIVFDCLVWFGFVFQSGPELQGGSWVQHIQNHVSRSLETKLHVYLSHFVHLSHLSDVSLCIFPSNFLVLSFTLFGNCLRWTFVFCTGKSISGVK